MNTSLVLLVFGFLSFSALADETSSASMLDKALVPQVLQVQKEMKPAVKKKTQSEIEKELREERTQKRDPNSMDRNADEDMADEDSAVEGIETL